MRITPIIAAAGLCLALAHVSPAQSAGWKCKAKNLKSYRYTGGSKAYIHLRPYKSGGRYPVTRKTPKLVTGRTKNGTKFECSKA